MITLSLNFDKFTSNAARNSHKKIREIVGTHFAFPGSDKLKVDVTVKDNGSSAVTFAGPKEVITEAKRLWQENVKPQVDKFKSSATKATTQAKKKAKSVLPKKKIVRVKVKTSKPRKKKK